MGSYSTVTFCPSSDLHRVTPVCGSRPAGGVVPSSLAGQQESDRVGQGMAEDTEVTRHGVMERATRMGKKNM